MTMLDTRQAQAALAAHIWKTLTAETDPETARRILTRAIEADASAAGQAFARQAPDGPSLAHFATVLERWQEGGALRLRDMVQSRGTLSFAVASCAYARMYRDMGLDPDLGHILSCARDEPFARGYSPCLTMRRTSTIMDGAPCCQFTFTWAC